MITAAAAVAGGATGAGTARPQARSSQYHHPETSRLPGSRSIVTQGTPSNRFVESHGRCLLPPTMAGQMNQGGGQLGSAAKAAQVRLRSSRPNSAARIANAVYIEAPPASASGPVHVCGANGAGAKSGWSRRQDMEAMLQ